MMSSKDIFVKLCTNCRQIVSKLSCYGPEDVVFTRVVTHPIKNWCTSCQLKVLGEFTLIVDIPAELQGPPSYQQAMQNCFQIPEQYQNQVINNPNLPSTSQNSHYQPPVRNLMQNYLTHINPNLPSTSQQPYYPPLRQNNFFSNPRPANVAPPSYFPSTNQPDSPSSLSQGSTLIYSPEVGNISYSPKTSDSSEDSDVEILDKNPKIETISDSDD